MAKEDGSSAKMCPKCGQDTLTFSKGHNVFVCTHCGFKAGLQS